jgi:hypothetical protein
MVLLQEQELRRFVGTWRRAKGAGLKLPETEDPDYASYDALLRHVLGASRGYLTWSCEKLGLPDPGVEPAPDVGVIDSRCDQYLARVLSGWREPLKDVPEERFNRPEYPSRWGVLYCVDAMLEHAVMHPIRHRFQLEELLGERSPGK